MEKNKRYSFLDVFKIAYHVQPGYLALLIVLILLNGLYQPIQLVVLQKLIDGILDTVRLDGSFKDVLSLFLLFILLQVYHHFFSTFDYFFGNKFNMKAKTYFLDLIIDKIARLEYSHIEDKKTNDLIYRIKKDAETNIKLTLDHTNKVISGIMFVLGLMVILYQVGLWISLAIMCIVLLTTFSAHKTANKEYVADLEYSQIERRMEYFEGLYTNREIASEMKLLNTAEPIQKKLDDVSDQVEKKYFMVAVRSRSTYEILLNFIGYILVLSMYLILLAPLKNNFITIGFYIATINASWQLVTFITTEVPYSIQYLYKSRHYWKEVDTFFQLIEIENKKMDKVGMFHEISFEDVYFKYPNQDEMILKGVSFKLKAKTHYAIVGKNGAGKSTIIKLLTGLYQVTHGKILIDGKNINEFSKDELSQLYSVVFQDFGKYYIPVIDHIYLGNKNIECNLNTVIIEAKKLDLHDTLEQLPQQYETMLGKIHDNGVDLSLGQWQKLVLLRSILSKRQIRILDEPTASLDPLAESKLYQMFADSLSKDVTTIIISHRLASTKIADEIILIDDGVVKEQGDHYTLMKLNGLYNQMFNTQKKWYVKEDEYASFEDSI